MKNLIRHGWMTALLVLLYCLPAMGSEPHNEGNSTFGIEVYEKSLPDQTNWHYLTVSVSGQDSGPLKGVLINIPFAGEDLGITGSGGQYATGDDGTIKMLLYGNGCTYQFQIAQSGYEPYSSGQFTMEEDREIRVILNRIKSNEGNHTGGGGGGTGGGDYTDDSGGNEYDSTESADKPDNSPDDSKQEESGAQNEPGQDQGQEGQQDQQQEPQAPEDQPAAGAAGDTGQGGNGGNGNGNGDGDSGGEEFTRQMAAFPDISEFKITQVPLAQADWWKRKTGNSGGNGGAAGNGGSAGNGAAGQGANVPAALPDGSQGSPQTGAAGPTAAGIAAGGILGAPEVTLVRSRETPVILSGMLFTLLFGLGRIGYMEFIRRSLYKRPYLEEFFDE